MTKKKEGVATLTTTCKTCGKTFSYPFRGGRPPGRWLDCVEGRVRTRKDYGIYAADEKAVERIATHLGCSSSEAVRTSIRVYDVLIKKGMA